MALSHRSVRRLVSCWVSTCLMSLLVYNATILMKRLAGLLTDVRWQVRRVAGLLTDVRWQVRRVAGLLTDVRWQVRRVAGP